MSITQIGEEKSGRISMENAVDHDTFGIVVFDEWTGRVRDILTLTVSRALKRDLVCVSDRGREYRFRRDGTCTSDFVRSPLRFFADANSTAFLEFSKQKEFEKRAVESHSAMKKIRLEEMDPELVDAIEAYLARQKTRQSENSDW